MRRYLNNRVWVNDFAAAYKKVLGSRSLLSWIERPLKIKGSECPTGGYTNQDCPRGSVVNCKACGAVTDSFLRGSSGAWCWLAVRIVTSRIHTTFAL